MIRSAHCEWASVGDPRAVTPDMLLFAIACMIVLEIQHLRWIWWEHWDCKTLRHEEQALRVRAVQVADLALS